MKIRSKKIEIPGGNGHYWMTEYDDFEYVNPVEHVATVLISSSMSFERNILQMKGISAPKEIIEQVLFKNAVSDLNKQMTIYRSMIIPPGMHTLLEATSKNDQIKALKGFSLTDEELMAFIIIAFEKYGYTVRWSKYHTCKRITF